MANGEQLHFDISTPRLEPQQSSGRPLATADATSERGDLVRGDVRMPGGSGGTRRALGPPSTLHPGRERSVTPRRGGLSQCLGAAVRRQSGGMH